MVNKHYNLYLKIYYKCNPNESIAISGSIDALGDWEEFTELEWTQGDYWVTRNPIESISHFFRYKYVIYDKVEKKLISWERGIDRIADLAILEPIDRVPNSNRIVQRQVGDKPLISVELEDEWEEFTVVFSVNHPTQDFSDAMWLDGNIASIDLLEMKKPQNEEEWMPVKYGEPMMPWKVEV